jgi:hypothetical protein
LPRFIPLAIIASYAVALERNAHAAPANDPSRQPCIRSVHHLGNATSRGYDAPSGRMTPRNATGAATPVRPISGVNLKVIGGHLAALAVRHEFEVHFLAFA